MRRMMLVAVALFLVGVGLMIAGLQSAQYVNEYEATVEIVESDDGVTDPVPKSSLTDTQQTLVGDALAANGFVQQKIDRPPGEIVMEPRAVEYNGLVVMVSIEHDGKRHTGVGSMIVFSLGIVLAVSAPFIVAEFY